MNIVRHRLENVPFKPTPNKGGALSPRYLVLHYTAAGPYETSVTWFQNPQARTSAHLVVGRGGELVQVVPFNRQAFHAGRSRWTTPEGETLERLNAHTLGIELANWGRLREVGGSYLSWTGEVLEPKRVVTVRHKSEITPAPWESYPQAQVDALVDVAVVLVRKYDLKGILGHDDIAPGRKSDPGPAFPLRDFTDRVMGQAEDFDDWVDEQGYLEIDEHYHQGERLDTTVARLVYNPASGTRKLFTR